MRKLAIISSSVREGRLSHRVALYTQDYIRKNHPEAEVEIIDLLEYDFPLFRERLAFQKNPSEVVLEFTERFNAAEGLIIVSPVYNADFPAALKNVIDLYDKEWKCKPCGVISVTSGAVPPIATIQKIQTLLLKLGALVAPALSTVIKAEESFTPEGVPADPTRAESTVRPLLDELLWLMEKTEKQTNQSDKNP